MSICYDEEQTRASGSTYRGSMSRINPTRAYLKHFENFLYLQFIAMNSDDRIEQHQARKELVIAERKMAFWRRSPEFNQTLATEGSDKLKKNWSTKR
jgi:hypothetical protein